MISKPSALWKSLEGKVQIMISKTCKNVQLVLCITSSQGCCKKYLTVHKIEACFGLNLLRCAGDELSVCQANNAAHGGTFFKIPCMLFLVFPHTFIQGREIDSSIIVSLCQCERVHRQT